MKHYHFAHQQEDADETTDLVVPCNVRPRRYRFVCWWCSHLNPARVDECEQCGEPRPEE